MVGEPISGAHSVDYLSSNDGVNFTVLKYAIVKPMNGHVKTRTPAMHPNNARWLYYGSTTDPSAMGNQILYQTWQ